MKIEEIENMEADELQRLVNVIKEKDPHSYEIIIRQYFREYSKLENPIVESAKDDLDEMWDCEAALREVCERMPDSVLSTIILNFE